MVLLVSFSYGDWKSDANTRIEQIRKRNMEITVLNSGGQPISSVSVQINQFGHRFAFGTCIRNSQMSNTIYKNFILNHFEWGVCENDTKWGANEATRDVVTYTNADNIYNWCAANEIKMRGHCLFWEQENSEFPNWLAALGYATYPTASDLLGEVDERIDSAVTHFKNKFYNWDVDNEMLSDNFFTSRLGTAGIVHMFNRAKTVDPNGGMFMNEYSGNSFGGYNSAPYVTRANTLISAGATIDGYGIQAHLAENATFDPASYYNNVLQPLAVFNKPIWATEFDASHTNATTSADNIENFMRICFSHAKVEGIIFWGFMNGQMWRTNAGLCESSGALTTQGVRYESLMDEWTTGDSNTTNSSGKVNSRGFHGMYEITLSKVGETNEIHEIELTPGSGTQQFTINTNFTGGTPDTTPPTPNPMTWSSVPAATGPSTITMTATTATDATSPPVQYYFECTNHGEANSTWQSSTTYVASGLNPSTSYSFRVKARDSSTAHNETGWSSTQSATTNAPDTTPPTPNPMTWATVPTATGSSTITMTATTATDATSPPVQYYFECTTDGTKSSGWQSSPTYIASGLTPLTQYSFRAKARDSAAALNETGWSSTLSATTQAPPTDINIIGSWATGTTHTKVSGTNRALIFIAHGEYSGSDMNLASVTYSGQAMTKVIERNASTGTGYRSYVAAFILKETGIAAASSSTFTTNWSITPESASYASVFLENVDQTTSIGASASNGTASGTDPISTDPLATSDGDIVILGATCGNLGSYTLGNSFTEGTDQSVGTNGHTGVTGYKFATGAAETPNANYSATVNRQVIIGFVVQAAAGSPPFIRTLTVGSSAGGTVTAPGIGSFTYPDGNTASIVASANTNYHFVNWTGTAVTSGKVANPNLPSTTVLMDANYTVQANFAIDQRSLTTSASAGGSVSTPGTGTYWYNHGTNANIVASASTNYHFVNWTGSAVTAGKVANPNLPNTTVLMDANYTIQANFVIDQKSLTTSASSGGTVTTPGIGTYWYDYNTPAGIVASAGINYHFVNWTGTAVTAGKVSNPNLPSTTVLMDANYTVQANFAIDQRSLIVSASEGGTVTTPGIGTYWYDHDTNADIVASVNVDYHFINWTGTAVTAGKVVDPNSADTTVLMDGNYTVHANFEAELAPAAPTSLTATAGSETAALNWNDNNEIDLAGYNVYRSTTQGSSYSKLNGSTVVGDSNYIDNGLTNGITYYYVVTAVDDANKESGYSNEASAVPAYQTCSDVQTGGDGLLSDLNDDCRVDYEDLKIISDYWLNTECGSYNNCDGADFEPTNGTVDFFDLNNFAKQWMQCNDPGDANCI